MVGRSLLSTMLLVWQLAGSGNADNPEGYNLFPRLSEAELRDGYHLFFEATTYNTYNIEVTWMEAKRLCEQEGAQLAVIDSVKKLEYFSKADPYILWSNRRPPMHAGIIRLDGEWVSTVSGLRVSSIPWTLGQPFGFGDCVLLHSRASGLANAGCKTTARYACEFPIGWNQTAVDNGEA